MSRAEIERKKTRDSVTGHGGWMVDRGLRGDTEEEMKTVGKAW